MGPGPWLLRARFARTTPLCYVSNFRPQKLGSPPWQNPGSAPDQMTQCYIYLNTTLHRWLPVQPWELWYGLTEVIVPAISYWKASNCRRSLVPIMYGRKEYCVITFPQGKERYIIILFLVSRAFCCIQYWNISFSTRIYLEELFKEGPHKHKNVQSD